jgi:hypothetical protein
MKNFGLSYPYHTFDPNYRLCHPDIDCDFVTLVSFTKDVIGDCKDFLWCLGKISYHTFQYCWRVPHEAWVLAPDKTGKWRS